jgi:hypothetical protein
MKGLNGFLIAIYSLAAMALSGAIMGLAAPFPFLDGFRTSSLELFNNWTLAVIAAAVFFLSLWIFLANVLPADRVKTINRPGDRGSTGCPHTSVRQRQRAGNLRADCYPAGHQSAGFGRGNSKERQRICPGHQRRRCGGSESPGGEHIQRKEEIVSWIRGV